MQINFNKEELIEILKAVKPKIYNEWNMYSPTELEVLESIVEKIEQVEE